MIILYKQLTKAQADQRSTQIKGSPQLIMVTHLKATDRHLPLDHRLLLLPATSERVPP